MDYYGKIAKKIQIQRRLLALGQKLSVTCTLLTVQGVFIYLAGGRSPNQRSPPFSFCDVTTTLHITHSIQLRLVAPRRFEESKYHEWKYFSI